MGNMIAYALLTQARAPYPNCPDLPAVVGSKCYCESSTPFHFQNCEKASYCNRTPGQAGFFGGGALCVKDCADASLSKALDSTFCKGSNDVVCRKLHVDTKGACPRLCSQGEGKATEGCVCVPLAANGYLVRVPGKKGNIECQCAAGGTCNKKGTSPDCSDVCLAPTGGSPDPDGSTPSSNAAAIVGGSIAAVALVGIAVGLYVWRTHRTAKDKHAKRKQSSTLRGRKSRRTTKGNN